MPNAIWIASTRCLQQSACGTRKGTHLSKLNSEKSTNHPFAGAGILAAICRRHGCHAEPESQCAATRITQFSES